MTCSEFSKRSGSWLFASRLHLAKKKVLEILGGHPLRFRSKVFSITRKLWVPNDRFSTSGRQKRRAKPNFCRIEDSGQKSTSYVFSQAIGSEDIRNVYKEQINKVKKNLSRSCKIAVIKSFFIFQEIDRKRLYADLFKNVCICVTVYFEAFLSYTITNFQFVEVYFLSRLTHAIHGYVYCKKGKLRACSNTDWYM